jgi:hypothetical protein
MLPSDRESDREIVRAPDRRLPNITPESPFEPHIAAQ